MNHNLKDYILMLEATVNGLKANGWREHGGSEVWRMLSKKGQTIKVYLNSKKVKDGYTNPTYIIIRKT